MDHSMPITETILSDQKEQEEATEAATIAHMTSDDDSDKSIAPSILHHQHPTTMTAPPLTDPSLFTIPSTFLQHPHVTTDNNNNNNNNHNIYHITAQQYHDLHTSYASHPMTPDTQLFPWLHGIDGLNYHECLFFGVRKLVVPRHRGLLVLDANQPQPQRQRQRQRRLVQALDPNDILDPVNDTFIKATTTTSSSSSSSSPSIHLRNFGIQPWRYASISDIVIYGTQATQVAHRVANAQQHIYHERQLYHQRLLASGGGGKKRIMANANDLTYHIFIITDPMDIIESHIPHLVTLDESPNFLELEKQTMRTMTKATELTDHLWVGNTGDAPTDDLDDDDDDDDEDDYGICIECHDLADIPTSSILTLARETLNENRGMIHLDMVSTCQPDEEEGDDDENGSNDQQTAAAALDTMADDVIGLLQFMDDMITTHGHKILVHCADGYTDTSVLALAWLMYKHHPMTLPDAYLHLQARRSFFVMSTDLAFLQHLSNRFLGITPTPTASIPTTPATATTSAATATKSSRILYDDHYLSTTTTATTMMIDETIQVPSPPLPPPAPSAAAAVTLTTTGAPCHWFHSPRFEGSFPSRILEFLFLGNLNHATNPGMLRALGITHVVSVGENTNLDPSQFQLLYLDNLYDDGIDSIKGRYHETMAFIDQARQQQTKCLVHCRVGVSRSAALTIGYVMQHCQMSLVEAYIFVRAHRLNVIIQPNLKFMYELLQLEQQLYGRVGLTWPVLCHQIHLLNQAYEEEEEEDDPAVGSNRS